MGRLEKFTTRAPALSAASWMPQPESASSAGTRWRFDSPTMTSPALVFKGFTVSYTSFGVVVRPSRYSKCVPFTYITTRELGLTMDLQSIASSPRFKAEGVSGRLSQRSTCTLAFVLSPHIYCFPPTC